MMSKLSLHVRARALALVAFLIMTVAGSVIVPATVGEAQPASALMWPEYRIDMSKFNAGAIITDDLFFNGESMSPNGIQGFLNEKNPFCQRGYVCLKSKRVNTYNIPANPMCKAYPGVRNEDVAHIIYKIGQACGISQKVILVTLQKEQGLVTDSWPSERQYEFAMGADCPDSGDGCGATAGLFQQLYRGAYMFKRYTQPPGTGPGTRYDYPFAEMKKAYTTVWVRYAVDPTCGSKRVYIANQATHVLYVYTPYTPNDRALAAGAGTATCGAYGNRNFYRYYFEWFGDPNGYSPKIQDPPDQNGDVAGQETVGQVLTLQSGRWTGSPTPRLSYQWYSCATRIQTVSVSIPRNCAAISRRNGSTYTLRLADVGKFIAPAITLTNQSGTVVRMTPTTDSVYQAPVNTRAPALPNTAQALTPLTVTAGTWVGSPAPTLTYQWSSCPSASSTSKCVPIRNATSAQITPSLADAGKYLVATVTATNRKRVTATTPSSVLVTAKPYVSKHATLTGSPMVGSAITATNAQWGAYPNATYRYEYFACPSRIVQAQSSLPGACTSFVPAQASPTAAIPESIRGKYVVARVTATNSVGTTSDVTASTAAIAIDPSLPVASGVAKVGSRITAMPGAWTGKSVQPWYRHGGPRANGYPIYGVQDLLIADGYGTPRTGVFDKRTQADVTRFQRAHGLTPDGIVGPRTWQTLLSIRVAMQPSFAYQWMACTTPVVVKQASTPESCTAIAGATSTAFTPTESQRGKFLVLRVSASQVVDAQARRWSLSTAAVLR